MKEVFARSLGHAKDVVGSVAVPLLAVPYQAALQIGHGVATAYAFPQIGRGCRFGHLQGFTFLYIKRLQVGRDFSSESEVHPTQEHEADERKQGAKLVGVHGEGQWGLTRMRRP